MAPMRTARWTWRLWTTTPGRSHRATTNVAQCSTQRLSRHRSRHAHRKTTSDLHVSEWYLLDRGQQITGPGVYSVNGNTRSPHAGARQPGLTRASLREYRSLLPFNVWVNALLLGNRGRSGPPRSVVLG